MRPKISKDAHDEQTFLAQIGAVALRLRAQEKLALGVGDARRHLEYHRVKVFTTGKLPTSAVPEGYTHGENWESWEQGQISLSSKKLHCIFEAAYGPTPKSRRRHPAPKSDAATLKHLEKLDDDLSSRHSKARDQLAMAIKVFKQSLSTNTKLTAGTQKTRGFQWKLPADLQGIPLMNAYDALEFYRDLYRRYRIPSSLTIPDVVTLITIIEASNSRQT